MKNQITVSGKNVKKALKRTTKKSQWEYATFEWKADRKTTKAMRELQQIEEVVRKRDRTCLRDLMMYLEGLKRADGLLPFGDIHIEALKNALKKL